MTGEIDRENDHFNQGVTHTVDLLAKTIGAPEGWVSGDGSEDYDGDLAQTLRNILEAKGLFDSETGLYSKPAADGHRCPSCLSPEPRLHPAMQFEGEVQPCGDKWHATASR